MRLLRALATLSVLFATVSALPLEERDGPLTRREFDDGKEINMRTWNLPRRDSERKTCVVPSAGDPLISDVPAIHAAFKECGAGGKIVLPEGNVYAINELLTMEGCVQCVVEFDGIFRQSANISQILETQTFFVFQNKSTSILLKGAKGAYIHSPAGTGGFEGNGQIWWEANKNASDLDKGTLRRPIMWIILESDHVKVDGLYIDSSPNWNLIVWNSTYVTIQNMHITALSNSTTLAKNTDGIDTFNTDHVLIQNSTIITGDDCVSTKGNSTNISVRNLYCEGTHGVSIGSLAQYVGVHDYVNGIYVRNVTFNGGENAIRIKVWPASPEHGSAHVENVFYKNVTTWNVDTPIFLESCYQTNSTYCLKYPSISTMQNIHIDDVRGNSSGKKNYTVGDLRCPPSAGCTVYLTDIALVPGKAGGNATFLCEGLAVDPGVPCKNATITAPVRRDHFALDELKWE